MSLKTPRALHFVPLVFALLAPVVLAQAPGREDAGIDLVFLVDVSWSMFHGQPQPSDPPTGNDPQRIRWDAVMLSMDLLTSEDRVLVIPFNHNAPATQFEDQQTRVPGLLNGGSSEPIDPRSTDGARVRDKVQTFIHQDNPRVSQSGEYNGDNGGTAIFLALEQAKKALSNPQPGHRCFVILLTDGSESKGAWKPEEFKNLKDSDSASLSRDPRVEQWLGNFRTGGAGGPRDGIKVYTIGLGPQIDDGLLRLIAQKTGGHYDHIQKNSELIETFRGLIWQLKGCWTKDWSKKVLAKADREEDLMAGIRDYGVLSYRVGPSVGARDFFALDKSSEFSFDRQPSLHTSGLSYTYDYGDRGLGEDVKLVTGWQPSASKRALLFSKRTVNRLFTNPDLRAGMFQRLEAMSIRIPMDLRSSFRPSQFLLTAFLREPGTDQIARGPIFLEFNDAKQEFFSDLNLRELPTRSGDYDGYTLSVTATGKAEHGDHSLRDYTLKLPPVDFRVENRLKLRADGPVRLSNEIPPEHNVIKIRTEKPFRVAKGITIPRLRVEFRRMPVDWQGKAVDIVQDLPNRPLSLREEDPSGQLVGDLLLEIKGAPEIGQYRGGEILISAVDSATSKVTPLIIPFEVAIKTMRLGLSRAPELDYEMGQPAVRSGELEVWANGAKLGGKLGVTVSIPNQTFGLDELWLESNGDTTKKLKLVRLLRPGDTFKIAFKPQENVNTPREETEKVIGSYSFDLTLEPNARGYEVPPQAGRVRLRYNAPKIQLGKLEAIRVQRGSTVTRTLEVGLEGAVPVERKVVLQCRARDEFSPQAPTFLSGGRLFSVIGLETDGPLSLRASKPHKPRPFPIRITVPREDGAKDFPCGEYALQNGELAADLTDPLSLELNLIVDDLRLTDPDGGPVSDPMKFFSLKGRDLVKKIRVFAERGTLKASDVTVALERPLVNVANNLENSDIRLEDAPIRECRDKDDRVGVEISLSFQGLKESFEQYSGNVVVRSKSLKLKKVLGCAVQRVEVQRPAGAKPKN